MAIAHQNPKVTMKFYLPVLFPAVLAGILVSSALAGGIVGAPAPFDKGGVKIGLG